MSHGRQQQGDAPAAPTWTHLMRRTYATDAVLTVLIAAWAAMALYLFLLPDPQELTDTLEPSLGHAAIFVALGATAMARLRPTSRRGVAKLFAAGVAGGIFVEVAQELLTSGRRSQWGDIVADAAGLALGMGLVAAGHRLIRRPALVNTATAAASAAVLVALTATVAIGPGTIETWLSCRGYDTPDDGLLFRLDADDVSVPGDDDATSSLRRQLAPLRITGPGGDTGYRFDGTDQVSVDEVPSIACGLRDAGTFTLVAHLEDLPPTQEGPARILTISEGTDPSMIDLHLAMVDDGASVRLRTSPSRLHQDQIPDLVDGDEPLELTMTYDGEALELWAGTRTVYRQVLDADPAAWRLDLPLTIGNEHTGNRPLEGTITRLDLYAGVAVDQGLS